MAIQSAGLLMYRLRDGTLEVLVVHPGGPYWQKRDDGSWSIPKGEIAMGEDGLDAARREFLEELGAPAPEGEFTPLGSIRQASGKVVHAWAVKGDMDVARLVSNTFEVEWPPHSRTIQRFPEVDRAAWLDTPTARRKLILAQRTFIDRLEELQ